MYNDWIDNDEIYVELFEEYDVDIYEDIGKMLNDMEKCCKCIDYEDIIDSCVRSNIDSYDLESKIDEKIHDVVQSTCDCEDIITEYGLEDAVNEYMSGDCVDVGSFCTEDCASYIIKNNSYDYGYEDLISDIDNHIIEKWGGDAEDAVKKIRDEYVPVIDIPDELQTYYDLLRKIRANKPDCLKNITLGEVDEVVVIDKYVHETYCHFTCDRCPFKQENCDENNMKNLRYAIYKRLYGKFTFDEYEIIHNVIKYCMTVEGHSIDGARDYLKDNWDISMDNNLEHNLLIIE